MEKKLLLHFKNLLIKEYDQVVDNTLLCCVRIGIKVLINLRDVKK